MCGVCLYDFFIFRVEEVCFSVVFTSFSSNRESGRFFCSDIYIGSHVYYIIVFTKKKFADENKELDKLDLKMGIVLGCRVCVVVDEKQLQL